MMSTISFTYSVYFVYMKVRTMLFCYELNLKPAVRECQPDSQKGYGTQPSIKYVSSVIFRYYNTGLEYNLYSNDNLYNL